MLSIFKNCRLFPLFVSVDKSGVQPSLITDKTRRNRRDMQIKLKKKGLIKILGDNCNKKLNNSASKRPNYANTEQLDKLQAPKNKAA